MSAKCLVQAVAEYFGFTLKDFRGNRRHNTLALARHVAMYLLRRRGLSYPEIAKFFDYDHTSIMNGVRRMRDRIVCEREVADTVALLDYRVNGGTVPQMSRVFA